MFTISLAPAQDAATQQQLDKMYGQIQDMQAAQELQGKRLDALAKQISELADKVNTPAVSDGATRDDLKALATQVQEIDKKRQADRELILKEIENLGKVTSGSPPSRKPKPVPETTAAAGDNSAVPASPQKGYEYKVQAGDTVGAIAKAYHDQGVKVTTSQILKANPKLDPAKLYVGQKIFIPDPAAK